MPANSLIINRLSSIVIALLLVFFANFSPIFAQTQTPLEKAQADYNFQYTKYKDSQEAYYTSKASYMSFKTAIAKTDAYNKTKAYLDQTDQLYLTFIALLKEYANSINWDKTDLQKETFAKLSQTEIDYITDHKNRVANTKTLEELPPLADELKTHLKDTTEPTFNKNLAMLELAQVEATLSDFNSLSRILDRIVIFKLRAGETQAVLSNWNSEIASIRTSTEKDVQDAKTKLDSFKDTSLSSGQLNEISNYTQDGQSELKRSKPLFEELVRIL